MNVNVVREAPIPGRRALRSLLFQNAEACGLPMDIGIIGMGKQRFEA